MKNTNTTRAIHSQGNVERYERQRLLSQCSARKEKKQVSGSVPPTILHFHSSSNTTMPKLTPALTVGLVKVVDIEVPCNFLAEPVSLYEK